VNDTVFVTGLVDRLLFGLVNVQVYGATNVRVKKAAAEAAERVRARAEEGTSTSALIGAVGDRIVFEGKPVLGASLVAKRLLDRIKDRGAGGVEIDSGATSADVLALLEVLARRGTMDLETANRELQARGARGARFVPTYGVPHGGEEEDGAGTGSGDAGVVISLHQRTVDLLQGLTISVCQGKDIDLGEVGTVVEGVVKSLSLDAGALHALARYPDHDFFTFGHSIRVGLLAVEVAGKTTDDANLVHRVGVAALLHDVGKALIPWEILHKRGPLDADERKEIQRHPVLGAGVLLANRDRDPMSIAAAYGHHCTMDGGGYPRTRGEFEQSMVTKLVKICDCYEALTAVRPYKKAMSAPKAFRTMLDMTGHFDEELLAHFIRTVGIHPSGTRVKLDNGEVARVVRQTRDFHRPVVQVLERNGDPIEELDRPTIDLTRSESGGPTRVEVALATTGDEEAPLV
jgi:HD-GYP domain-containing protein (c-di-GMP phosphodiesterase class II)